MEDEMGDAEGSRECWRRKGCGRWNAAIRVDDDVKVEVEGEGEGEVDSWWAPTQYRPELGPCDAFDHRWRPPRFVNTLGLIRVSFGQAPSPAKSPRRVADVRPRD